MEINDIIQLIGSLGFPIVACCALFWMLNKETTLHKEEMNDVKEILAGLKVAIDNLIATLRN